MITFVCLVFIFVQFDLITSTPLLMMLKLNTLSMNTSRGDRPLALVVTTHLHLPHCLLTCSMKRVKRVEKRERSENEG